MKRLTLKLQNNGDKFFARILPTKKRKKELHDAIDADNTSLIQTLVHETYDSIYMDWSSNKIKGGCVHLGKRSGGWKFLWNPNVFMVRNGHTEWEVHDNGSRTGRWVPEPSTPKYLYPLTKGGIKAFIDRKDIEIYDEYGELQDKEVFFKEAIEWITWNGHEAWDADSYDRDNPHKHSLSCKNEFTDFLESLGYKLSENKSDFYSDGLRFSTSTEFS